MTSILAIEDDPAIRAALERGLAERGHTVQTAGTGSPGSRPCWATAPTSCCSTSACPTSTGSS